MTNGNSADYHSPQKRRLQRDIHDETTTHPDLLQKYDRAVWSDIPRPALVKLCRLAMARCLNKRAANHSVVVRPEDVTVNGVLVNDLPDDDILRWLQVRSEHIECLALLLTLGGFQAVIPDSNPRNIDDITDDETLYARKRENWGDILKPILLRVAQRHWTYGEKPLYHPNGSENMTCAELADLLRVRIALAAFVRDIDKHVQRSIPDEPHLSARANAALKSSRTVLGSTVLEEVWADIKCTVIPSWINPLPQQLGTANYGTLSADQWRWLTTLILPITLIRLWGDLDRETRYFRMLENFLWLVCVLDLATRRSTNSERRAAIFEAALNYLDGLKSLFPQIAFTVNLHLMCHLPKLLYLWGPPHAWWCFPYERFNGILQQIPTNSHFGEWDVGISD